MQEVFEKIIEKLAKEKDLAWQFTDSEDNQTNARFYGKVDAFEKAIEIVKQAAEEYDNGWILSERLLRKIIEKFSNIYRVVENDEDLGWNRAVYKCEEIVNQMSKERGTTNFEMCCESMEAMAQIIDIAKIGWTKEQIMEWLQKEECEAPE